MRPIQYIDLPIDQWRSLLVEQVGLPEFLVNQLAAVAQDHKDGIFSAQTNVVERIGGQPPQSLEHFIQGHLQEFSAGPVLSQQA